MDGQTTVPLAWLIVAVSALVSAIIGAFLWWLRNEFSRIDERHESLAADLRGLHKRVDFLIFRLIGRAFDDGRDGPEREKVANL